MRNLAVIRTLDPREIKMDYGNLDGWSDIEIREALSKAQLLTLYTGSTFGLVDSIPQLTETYLHYTCMGDYRNKIGIYRMIAIRTGRDVNLGDLEETELSFTEDENERDDSIAMIFDDVDTNANISIDESRILDEAFEAEANDFNILTANIHESIEQDLQDSDHKVSETNKFVTTQLKSLP